MKELQRQGETQKERSVHLLAPQVTVSASVRLAQRQELPVCLQWGQWGPNISALLFPGPKQGAGSEAEHLGRRPAHTGDLDIAGDGFTCYTSVVNILKTSEVFLIFACLNISFINHKD